MKIAIVHRDRLTREAIRRAVGAEYSLAWFAADRRELETLRRREPPDLVLIEAAMVDAQVIRILESGRNWLVLATDENAHGVYEALSAGALGHVPPPRLEPDGELTGGQRLLKRIQRLQALIPEPVAALEPMPAVGKTGSPVPVIAIGASTGGPKALASVLSGLPAELNAAVMIVQHIEADFSTGLVEWLASHARLPVQLARRGDLVEPGRVYLGANQGHLVLLPSQQIGYLAPMKNDLHVPSVDMLFQYLADHHRPGSAAVLTGMGSDGALGLLRLRQRGWFTVAQDQTSSAVFGMPRAAADCGGALQVLPLSAIGQALARHVCGMAGR